MPEVAPLMSIIIRSMESGEISRLSQSLQWFLIAVVDEKKSPCSTHRKFDSDRSAATSYSEHGCSFDAGCLRDLLSVENLAICAASVIAR